MAAQIWRIGSRIILTPIIIAQLGLEAYGTWTLLFTICAYTAIIDRTFNAAYTKFTAQLDAEGDHDRLSVIISSGVVLVALGAGLILTLIYVLREPAFALLQVPEVDAPIAGRALGIICIAVFIRIVMGYALQVLSGLQRLDLQHKLLILASIIEFAVSLGLLHFGWGLEGLAIGHLGGQIVAVVAAWWLCRIICPQLHVSPRSANREGLKAIGSLGGRFQLVAALQLLLVQGIKLLISGLFGVATLGIYELAFKLLRLGNAVSFALVAPLMPAFANLQARGTNEDFRAVVRFSSKAVSVIALPAFSFIAIFADRLIFLWTGQDYPLAAWTIRCMAPGLFVLTLTAVGTASLRGRGTVRLEFTFILISAITLAALVVPFYWLWGYEGIIFATVVRSVVGAAWFIVSFAREERFSVVGFLREAMLRPLVVLGPVLLLTAAVGPDLRLPWGLASGRMSTLLDLAVVGGAFVSAIALSAWFGLLSERERVDFRRRFGPAKKSMAAD